MAIIWEHYLWSQDMPLDMTKLEAVEHAWGIQFPQDYKDCIAVNQGKTPNPNEFSFGDGYATVFNHLYHFERHPSNSNIVESQRSLQMGELPANVYVFACDPAGNSICFDYRESDSQPNVVLWHHDAEPEVELVHVADSFTAFLEQLY